MNYKTKIKAITWNIRGLNERPKRLAIRETMFREKPDIVCMQETKLEHIDDRIQKEICGRCLNGYITRPANGTIGGMLIAWRESRFQQDSSITGQYCLTVQLYDRMLDQKIKCTMVYGPTNAASRGDFFQELTNMKPTDNTPWIINGDFNITLEQADKNQSTQDWRWPLAFSDLISNLELQNIRMEGRKFTWSNYRDNPTMAKLDRFFLSNDWSQKFPNTRQKTLPNTSSDHCPIMIEAITSFKKFRIFRFENFWLQVQGFKTMVQERWQQSEIATTPMQLHNKLQDIEKTVATWAKNRTGSIKQQNEICRQFINWTEEANETRRLTDLEKRTKAIIKHRFTQLAEWEEEMWKQRAKMKWEVEGDKNTRFFHMYASRSKAGNAIGGIQKDGQIYTDQRRKAEILREYYINLMGTNQEVEEEIDWEQLYPARFDLSELAQPVTEEEINESIASRPSNKALGPDGFCGEFYKAFQQVLLPDIRETLKNVMQGDGTLFPLNNAITALIPKTDNATNPKDFRPISLINGIQKIISKILATRLQGKIQGILHKAQT